MRRTDRLFELIQIFRDRQVHRAIDLAEIMGVSVRTIYRDIESLVGFGVAIDGERGLGYLLREPVTLPPLMFRSNEIEALHLAAEMAKVYGGAGVSEAIDSVLAKVRAVLPGATEQTLRDWPWSIYRDQAVCAPDALVFKTLSEAITNRKIVTIDYCSLSEEKSRREIWPLGLECWGTRWTCTSWCEERDAFRVFRIDRIKSAESTGRLFSPIPGRTLEDFLQLTCSDDA